jgi:hypothetical protein
MPYYYYKYCKIHVFLILYSYMRTYDCILMTKKKIIFCFLFTFSFEKKSFCFDYSSETKLMIEKKFLNFVDLKWKKEPTEIMMKRKKNVRMWADSLQYSMRLWFFFLLKILVMCLTSLKNEEVKLWISLTFI